MGDRNGTGAEVEDFLRLYPMRAPQLMWLIGAGASSAAGLPTAMDMTWDFKRTIYCSEQRISIRQLADVGDPAVRARLHAYFDASGKNPGEGADDEYAHYFEYAYPSEADRRTRIDQLVSEAKPSFGHRVLAALMKPGKVKVAWTTNFDSTVEDAASESFGTTAKLVVATTDNSQIAGQALSEERFPLLVKMHGDFRSRRLKNVSEEVLKQDEQLRTALLVASKRYGLIVIGYSGRDVSIMDTLRAAIGTEGAFPAGLFWFHRSDSPPSSVVRSYIDSAAGAGVDARLLEIETFDELLGDILRLIPEIPLADLGGLSDKETRVSQVPLTRSEGALPFVRLNALALEAPSVCRRVVCGIGGYADLRRAISDAGVQVLAARRNIGVLAFGEDDDLRKCLDPYDITEFDLHSLDPERMRYETAEAGLLYQALAAALARELPLLTFKLRNRVVASVDPDRQSEPILQPLTKSTQRLSGKLSDQFRWAEAIRLSLDYRYGQLWLLLQPAIWIVDEIPDQERDKVKEFIRARLAGRYNRQHDQLLTAWAEVIGAGTGHVELRALGITSGVDAVFRIGAERPISRRRMQ